MFLLLSEKHICHDRDQKKKVGVAAAAGGGATEGGDSDQRGDPEEGRQVAGDGGQD